VRFYGVVDAGLEEAVEPFLRREGAATMVSHDFREPTSRPNRRRRRRTSCREPDPLTDRDRLVQAAARSRLARGERLSGMPELDRFRHCSRKPGVTTCATPPRPILGGRTAIASLVTGAEVAVSVVRVVEIRGAAPRGCVGLDRGAHYVSSSFAAV
jgi:hypothetical protein